MTAHSPPEVRWFATVERLADALAGEIQRRLAEAVEARGRASLVVPGGSTPGPLYDVLAGRPLPWERIQVTLSDERWVDPSDMRSNEGLVRARLTGPTGAPLTALKTVHEQPEDAEPWVHAALAALPRPFDVVLLGMGTDGHVASLFPDADGLPAALDLEDPALARAVRPEAGPRMTLTLRALLDSRGILIMIRGEEKLERLSACEGLPVGRLLSQGQTPVEVWAAP